MAVLAFSFDLKTAIPMPPGTFPSAASRLGTLQKNSSFSMHYEGRKPAAFYHESRRPETGLARMAVF
jgi:hypothetical protein